MKEIIIKHLEKRIELYENELKKLKRCSLRYSNIPKKSGIICVLQELNNLLEVINGDM